MGVLRKTKHLEHVLQAFRQSSDALSAGMLVDALANEINKSTVYRMLQKLEDDGVIHSFLGPQMRQESGLHCSTGWFHVAASQLASRR